VKVSELLQINKRKEGIVMRLMVMDAMTFGWGILKIALAVTAAWIAADLRTNKKKHSVFISA
jgi:hypothetical protein